MSRFFFNLHDEMHDLFDPEGVDLPSLSAAKRAALVAAFEIMTADIREGKLALDTRIEVRDEHGAVVFVVRFRDIVEISEGATALA